MDSNIDIFLLSDIKVNMFKLQTKQPLGLEIQSQSTRSIAWIEVFPEMEIVSYTNHFVLVLSTL